MKNKVYIPILSHIDACSPPPHTRQKINKEGVGRISSNSGYTIQKKYMVGKLFTHNLWCKSTQIEYTSQKMAKQ